MTAFCLLDLLQSPNNVGFLGPMPILILESKKIPISDISSECGYQILVTKIWNGGKISSILTNFIPNIRALNSKHFTY